ncbi:MAG: carbonic anhydrase [Bryobacterales bacterium]|nr:carbonic anhydrase [Bryobacterales bacterium]
MTAVLGAAEVRSTAPPLGASAPSAEVALEWLRYGNERHMAARYVHWHQSAERRREVARAERPHAVVVTCSDSRVAPELLFDQGLGDLYVVRVPAHAIGDRELAAIEHAAAELRAPLIVVLGHQGCHAIHAAAQGTATTGRLGAIVASLAPAVARARRVHGGDPAENIAREHVAFTVEQIAQSEPVLSELVRMRKVQVVGGYYRLDSGEVSWIHAAATSSSDRH